MGSGNQATDDEAVARYGGNKTDGAQGVATGESNQATAGGAVVMGGSDQATGLGAYAIGLGNQAGPMAFAMGMENRATTHHSSEAAANSGQMYAKKLNVVASHVLTTKAHAANGREQLCAEVQPPIHDFSPSDEYCVSCVSNSMEGKGNVSHQHWDDHENK